MEEIGYISLVDEEYIRLPYRIGQTVNIGTTHDIDAIVIGIIIRSGNHICYECAWMNSGERRTAVFDQTEIRSSRRRVTHIGFTI
jgi:hypothetical protein